MKLYARIYLPFNYVEPRSISIPVLNCLFHFVNEWNMNTFNLIYNFDSRSQLRLFMICHYTLAREIRNWKYGPEKCECACTAPEPVHHNLQTNAHKHILIWLIGRGETRWLNWDYIFLCREIKLNRSELQCEMKCNRCELLHLQFITF